MEMTPFYTHRHQVAVAYDDASNAFTFIDDISDVEQSTTSQSPCPDDFCFVDDYNCLPWLYDIQRNAFVWSLFGIHMRGVHITARRDQSNGSFEFSVHPLVGRKIMVSAGAFTSIESIVAETGCSSDLIGRFVLSILGSFDASSDVLDENFVL